MKSLTLEPKIWLFSHNVYNADIWITLSRESGHRSFNTLRYLQFSSSGGLVWGRNACDVHCVQALYPCAHPLPRPLHGCALCQTREHAAELRLCQLPADGAGGPAGLSPPAPAPLFSAQHQHGLPAQCQVLAAGVRCMHAWVRPGLVVGQAHS